ncbi:hypothetical protein [Lactococcus formosensis]|uniref:Phage protein n=1 Tax=Lactococcus formosensis TaxID=1281486 RepID=A0A9Q8Y028_9LACT|nr:hypothetical protein [Lactococcus formosensis]USJ19547.1 hypothetical protein LMK00_06840 [Lactococcus formosensis]
MIKFKDFYVSDSDYEEQMELFQNEYPNAEFIQITGGHMSPERIWFKYDDKLKEQPKLSIPKKIAEIADETWGYGDIDPLDIFGDVRLPDFENWWKSQDHPKDLIVAYLAGKALGVELVEVEE